MVIESEGVMNFKNELNKIKEFSVGMEILDIIENNGHKSFFVGGCVRDLIMGLKPHDIDITTNMPMEEIEKLFDTHNIGQSKDFGIVVVNHKGFSFEVAQFRVDSEESNGRHPNEVTLTNSFESDVKRRDFTINALGLNKSGDVIDFVGGVDDIKKGIIRTVGDPIDRFTEDHLRMMRAVRFSSRFNFKIEDNTFAAIRMLKDKIDDVSKERIKDELTKMASGDGILFERGIRLLDKTRILEVILPEVKSLQDVQEDIIFHPEAYKFGDGTSFDHTMEAIKQNTKKDPMINLCVLFHDLGKAQTHKLEFMPKRGKVCHRFTGHGNVGVDIIEELCKRLKFTNHEKSVFQFVSKNHMVMFHTRKMKKSTIVKHGSHDLFPILKEVMFCDDSCRIGRFDIEDWNDKMDMVDNLVSEFKQLKSNNTIKIVNGNDVMELTGIKQGKMVGEIIKTVTDRFLDTSEFVCLSKLIKDVANELR